MTSLVARLLIVCLLLFAAGFARAQVPDDIKIGAIRWDAWFEGAPDTKVLEQPEWRHRAPFFARYDENGKLHLDGDKEHVLHAEVAYARAIGVDYFIFGYYPETGSWGRDPVFHKKLNGALASYLALSDRMGVKFALSLNQLFPMIDVTVMAETVARFAAHPDYMRTQSATLPIFILADYGPDWLKSFGSEKNAQAAIKTIRDAVRQKTQIEITFILMNYESKKASEATHRLGLDMVSTYSNYAPFSGPIGSSYDKCATHNRNVWARAEADEVSYAPNVTLGWDNRPRRGVAVNEKNLPQGPWCGVPSTQLLASLFLDASNFLIKQARAPFQTIVVYAWNEFAEGGWMAPSVSNSDTWLITLRDAIGRNRLSPPVVIEWPIVPASSLCAAANGDASPNALCAGVNLPHGTWPCPPGLSVLAQDELSTRSSIKQMQRQLCH